MIVIVLGVMVVVVIVVVMVVIITWLQPCVQIVVYHDFDLK